MGHAIYIGRVGALAVALGVGVAAATGYGIGSPAVAWAEEGKQSSDNAPDTANDPTDAPADNDPADTNAPNLDSGPTTGGAPLSGLDEDPDLDEDADLDEDLSGLDEDLSGLDEDLSGLDEDGTDLDATTPTPIVHPPQTPTPQTEGPTPIAATDTAVVTPADINTPTLIQDPNSPTDQDNDANAGQFSGEQPSARTMSTLTFDDPAAPQMFTAAGPLTPAPAPLTAQSANLIDALSGAPAALANIAITAINTLLTSIFSPGPATPAPPMMLFIVLGWVQRELQRSSFNQSPTAVVDTITTSEDTGVNIAVLANDIDADVSAPVAGLPGGDVLTVTDYTQPAHGSVVLNEDRTFTYTPNANYTGTDTFTYTVSDEASPWHAHGLRALISGGGHTSTTTATITITPVDDAPVAVNDGPISVVEDSGPTLIQVLANDTDADAGPIKVQNVTDPAGGSVTFTDTTVTYTPDANFNGTDTFSYTLNGGSTTTVTVTVTAVDDAPVAIPDATTVAEDSGPTLIQVLANDTDIDAGPKQIVEITQPTHGTATTTDTTVIYTPDANFNGTDTFSYTLNGGSTATVTVTVTAVDDNPVANPDFPTTDEDSAFIFDALYNDTDIDAGPKEITVVTQPTHGTAAVIGESAAIIYTPDANFNGSDTFTYTLNGGSTATVTVTVTAVDDNPVAVADAATVAEDSNPTTIDVLANDLDADAGPQQITAVTQPTAGTVTFTDTTLTYTPNPDAFTTTPDTFTYTLNGGSTATVAVTITAVNEAAPVIEQVTSTPGVGNTWVVSVTASDIDGDAISTTVTAADATIPVTVTQLPGGGFQVVADPTWAAANPGALVPVTVTVTDTHGTSSTDTRNIGTANNVTAIGLNNAGQLNIPALPAGVTYTEVAAGRLHTVLLRSDGTAIAVGHNASGQTNIPALPAGVTYTDIFDSDGGADYTALLRSDGNVVSTGGHVIPPLPDGVRYIQAAGSGSHLVLLRSDGNAVTIGGPAIPELPDGVTYTQVAAGGSGNAGYHTVLLRSDGTAVGVGSNSSGQINIPALPAGVTYTQVAAGVFGNTVLLRSDGTAVGIGQTFGGLLNIPAPPAGVAYTQVDVAINYTVLLRSDGTVIGVGGDFSDTGGENIPALPAGVTYTQIAAGVGHTILMSSTTAAPVNAPPVATNDIATVAEGTTATIALTANDTDADGTINAATVVITGQPTAGNVTVNPNGTVTYESNGAEVTSDSFKYRVNDNTGATSNEATVTITVTPNDPPVAVNDTATVGQGNTATIALTANDTDTDGTIDPATIVITQQPTAGTVTANPNGTVTYVSDGTILTPDSFTYTVKDNTGATSNPATVTINIINERPVAADQFISILEDTSVSIDPLAGATDAENDIFQWGRTEFPAVGEIDMDYRNGLWSIIYTPPANYTGQATFKYQVIQGISGEPNVPYGESNEATVTITIIPVNDAPVANNDTATVAQGDTTTITLTANDTDVDDPINTTTVAITQQPTAGSLTVNPDGTVAYTSTGNAASTDSFKYTVNDNTGATSNEATVTITITITAVNDAPVAADDSYSTNEDTALTVASLGVLSNDSDAEGSSLTAVLVTDPSHGTLTLNSNGSFTYTPTANYNGPDSFTYKVNDGSVDSNVATVNVTVNSVNDAPGAANDGYDTNEDTPLVITGPGVLGNDTDPESNPLTAVKITDPTHGTVTLNSNGSFTYTPAANYNGPDSFTYTANDGTLNSNVATVNVTVNSVNDAPVGASDSYTLAEDTTLTIPAPGLLANDFDAEGPLVISNRTSVSHGTIEVFSNGAFTYTPTANYNGTDSFTYRVSDGTVTSAPITVNFTITPVADVNDAPVGNTDAYTLAEDTTLNIPAPGLLSNDTDANGQQLSITDAIAPAHGTLAINPDGSFTYTPSLNYNGPDSFSYQVSDGIDKSAPTTVNITVTPVNDAPVINNDTIPFPKNGFIGFSLQNRSSDVDNDTLTATLISGTTHGELFFDGVQRVFTYKPNTDYVGEDSFTYKVNDGTVDSPIATVTLNVS